MIGFGSSAAEQALHRVGGSALRDLCRRHGADPDLEPGFPVKTFERAGTYHGGPAILTLVGNIDSDPTLEILATLRDGS